MTYLSPRPFDHGLLDYGCRAYGGLAYRAGTLESIDITAVPSTSSSQAPHHRFITEHNLALYWQRPGLNPSALGFPIPLMDLSQMYSRGVRNRLPGMIRADCAPLRYRRRNLLAGRLIQDRDDVIRIWAVNDLSDRKKLLQFDVTIKNANECGVESLISLVHDNEANNEHLSVDLPSEAFELSQFHGGEDSDKVFVRTKHALVLGDFDEIASTSIIFNSPVLSFTQIPYMNDEVAIIDSANFLFTGSTETGSSSFARFKTPLEIKAICPTDCPRILIAMCSKGLYQLDTRVPKDPGQLLYSHSRLQQVKQDVGLPVEFYNFLTEREEFCHVNTLDLHLDTVLLTTSRRHFLVDRRLPGTALLSMGHAEMDGSDFCLSTPPFIDPETGGRIYSLFSLTHVRRPSLSHWSVMYHPKEMMWSSLGPKYHLKSPRRDIPRFTENHVRAKRVNANKLPQYTRAIHYQPLSKDLAIGKGRAILFRQMDGGEIWYDNIVFNPNPSNDIDTPQARDRDQSISPMPSTVNDNEEINYSCKLQAVRSVAKWLRKRKKEGKSGPYHAYFENVNQKFTKPTKSLLTVVNVKSFSRFNSNEDSPFDEFPNPMDSIGSIEHQSEIPIKAVDGSELNVVKQLDNEAKTFSKMVLSMHRKAKAYYSNKSSSRVRVKSNGSDSIMDWENELADEDDDEDVPSPSPKSSKHRAIKDEIMEDFSGIFGNDDKKEVKMHSKLKIPPIDR